MILPLLLLFACKVTGIEDGARFGPLTQVKLSYTSVFVGETEGGALVLFDAGPQEDGAKMLSCPSSVSVHSVTKTAFGPNFAGSKGCSRRIITHRATSSRRMMATVATILSLLRATRRS